MHFLKFLLLILLLIPQFAHAKILNFGGQTWNVRHINNGNPNNNNWSDDNAFVDIYGNLHLKITNHNGVWKSAEIYTQRRLGLGTYQIQIASRIDQLDKNVVFGMFSMPTEDIGPEGSHEIDIEFTKWGKDENGILNYTIWPINRCLIQIRQNHDMILEGFWTTHRIIRGSNRIIFQSTHGHYDDNKYPIAEWHFQPENPQDMVSQAQMPFHFNLWLRDAPSDNKEVEVIINQFRFIPQ